MEVWISRDSQKAGGYVLAWAKEPEWDGTAWFFQMPRFTCALWSWEPIAFEDHFGFLPEPGTCQKMRMQLEAIEPIEDTTERDAA